MQRQTQQRRAIREAILVADRPLSPREILDEASAAAPGLGIATVYRHLKALADEGWIQTVELPGAPGRYEVADKAHHHHFHCRECDKVYEVDACPGRLDELAPRGFRVESHEIILYGRCAACRR